MQLYKGYEDADYRVNSSEQFHLKLIPPVNKLPNFSTNSAWISHRVSQWLTLYRQSIWHPYLLVIPQDRHDTQVLPPMQSPRPSPPWLTHNSTFKAGHLASMLSCHSTKQTAMTPCQKTWIHLPMHISIQVLLKYGLGTGWRIIFLKTAVVLVLGQLMWEDTCAFVRFWPKIMVQNHMVPYHVLPHHMVQEQVCLQIFSIKNMLQKHARLTMLQKHVLPTCSRSMFYQHAPGAYFTNMLQEHVLVYQHTPGACFTNMLLEYVSKSNMFQKHVWLTMLQEHVR